MGALRPRQRRPVEVDAELVRLTRGGSALRLEFGAALDEFARRQGHHRMGVAALPDWVSNECGQSARWAADSAAVAVRLQRLPCIYFALVAGRIGWSMAEVLSRLATPETDAALAEEAAGTPVREMGARLKARLRRKKAEAAITGGGPQPEGRTLAGDFQHVLSWASGRSVVLEELGITGSVEGYDDVGDMRQLSLTLDDEDAWLLEQTRMLIEKQHGRTSAGAMLEACLAEGLSTFQECVPEVDFESDPRHARRLAERARQRTLAVEAERRAEKEWIAPTVKVVGERAYDGVAPDLGAKGVGELRTYLLGLARRISNREIRIGQAWREFRRLDGRKRLGYASDAQYARERLGVSLRWLRSRGTFEARTRQLPKIVAAHRSGGIHYEAAQLVARVAEASTDGAWAERAACRTVLHLREEVRAVELIMRLTGARGVEPPSEELMRELREMEAEVTQGAVAAKGEEAPLRGYLRGLLGGGGRDVEARDQERGGAKADEEDRRPLGGQMFGGAGSGEGERARGGEGFARERPMSGDVESADEAERDRSTLDGSSAPGARSDTPEDREPGRSRGSAAERSPEPPTAEEIRRRLRGRGRHAPRALARTTFRFWVREDIYDFFRDFERAYEAREAPIRFVRFLCLAYWDSWGWDAEWNSVAWQHIYRRDLHVCANPMCSRRDLTPHHIQPRSKGGGDEDENLVSLCVWCHLSGVHDTRTVEVTGPAGRLRWRLGRPVTTEVYGREKRQVAA